MREIKFRAWDTKRHKMIHHPICLEAGTFTDHVGLNDMLETFALRGFILMLSTGLKDKNGKDIYEGDIIYNGAERVPVEWKNEMWTEEGFITGFSEFMEGANCYEVIGNIHENPEIWCEENY